ncbi:uncharacterized protein BKA78DRAFT_114634 [Phyllosticta capitalensis]|uniref:uncharacterized protein n=1 Tax=Phyllosticta capitalensis TaxID=121624 RepID=UPI00312D8F58
MSARRRLMHKTFRPACRRLLPLQRWEVGRWRGEARMGSITVGCWRGAIPKASMDHACSNASRSYWPSDVRVSFLSCEMFKSAKRLKAFSLHDPKTSSPNTNPPHTKRTSSPTSAHAPSSRHRRSRAALIGKAAAHVCDNMFGRTRQHKATTRINFITSTR